MSHRLENVQLSKARVDIHQKLLQPAWAAAQTQLDIHSYVTYTYTNLHTWQHMPNAYIYMYMHTWREGGLCGVLSKMMEE